MVEEEIRTLGRGDYFGEQSLIKEDKRSANIIAMSPGVECLTLDREAFKQHIGDLEELQEKDYGDRDRMYAIRQIEFKQIQLLQQEREIERGKRINELENNGTCAGMMGLTQALIALKKFHSHMLTKLYLN